MGKKLIINPGDSFYKWTIIKEVSQRGKNRYFQCKCECGILKEVGLHSIKSGTSKTCGCIYIQSNKTHGMKYTRIYKIWEGMKDRCDNHNNPRYESRGGRGIIYDKQWITFLGFYDDMKKGYSNNLTLDRINNNGNYNKNNCRWATVKEQARNKRNNVMYKGKCLAEYREMIGMTKSKFDRLRYVKNLSLEDIFNKH